MTSSRPSALRSLAIAAPAYNEAAGIEVCVSSWMAALSSRPGLEYGEIVVCDDGSRDETGAILDRLASTSRFMRPVHHAANRGAAQAMSTAIAHTKAEWVLLLDADGQFPIECLDAFEHALAEHPEALAFIGARATKHDARFARMGAWLTSRALNALHGTHYDDLSSACQLVRGDVLRAMHLEARGLNYSVEISARLLEARIRPVQVAIEHRARTAGRSTRTLIRSTLERASFVGYFAARRALLGARVIVSPLAQESRCASR